MSKRVFLASWAGLSLLAGLGCAPPVRPVPDSPPIEPGDLARLARAGVREEVILDLAGARGLGASLSAEDVVWFKEAGLSDRAIEDLVRTPVRRAPDADWDGPYWVYGDPYCPLCPWDAAYAASFVSVAHHHHAHGHHHLSAGHGGHFGGHHAHHGGHH